MLLDDFNTLCDFGGRLCGTDSERDARRWLFEAGARALGVKGYETPIKYQGWRANKATLTLMNGEALPCHPLVRSKSTPAGGLTAEVVDLGRGLESDFEQHADVLKGRIALFRHEVMFSATTFHRRQKLRLAREAGAVAALVAAIVPDELVTGSSRGEGEDGIPAMGITEAAAQALAPVNGQFVTVNMVLDAQETPSEETNLIFDLPGKSDHWVVLSAHIDGHDLAESAMDNATGVAAALEIARRIKAMGPQQHGLRMAFFSVEEWGLTGSEQYLAGLSEQERDAILLNVNLDTVAGGQHLTALTSGFSSLARYIESMPSAREAGLRIFDVLQRNSDHANFALNGIPAYRLLSGFDEPESNVRYVLTGQDTRDKVNPADLERAVDLTTAMLTEFLCIDEDMAGQWRITSARHGGG